MKKINKTIIMLVSIAIVSLFFVGNVSAADPAPRHYTGFLQFMNVNPDYPKDDSWDYDAVSIVGISYDIGDQDKWVNIKPCIGKIRVVDGHLSWLTLRLLLTAKIGVQLFPSFYFDGKIVE
jgi:hypothetical protein